MITKVKNCLLRYKWQLFLVFWLANVVLSIVYKFYYYYTGNHLQYTWVSDMFFLMFLFIAISKKENKWIFISIAFLLLCKIIGSTSITSFYQTDFQLYKDVIKTWMGYVFLFPLFLFLIDNQQQTNQQLVIPSYMQKSFVMVAGGLAISVFVGLIFKSYVFYTYTGTERFGFSGFIYPFSYVSYFYMLSIPTTYYLHKHLPKEKMFLVLLYVLVLAAIFAGTKSTYLFLLFFCFLLILDRALYKNKWFWVTSVGALVLTLLIHKKILQIFLVLVDLYEKERFWTFALSYRDFKIHNNVIFVQENWTWANYLFGGLNNSTQLTEMAFVDLFLNFGGLGTILFLYLYYHYILKRLVFTPFNLAIGVGLLILIGLGGNFFDRVYLAYWLVLYFLTQMKFTSHKHL